MSVADEPSIEPLFRPLTVHGVTLANRIAMSPMARNFMADGVPSSDYVAYFRRRAEGGAGLLFTEATSVDHPSAQIAPNFGINHGDAAATAWKAVVDGVHDAGGRIFAQLFHAGMSRPAGALPFPEVKSLGPSGLAPPASGADAVLAAEPMTDADIAAVVTGFGNSAENAQRIGFDGIELHGAHGYLLDQFFWEKTNLRSDGYGGDIAARTRFAVEVIAECRRRVGPRFPISLRISQWKMSDFGARLVTNPAELERLLAPLVLAGVDLIHCSERRISDPAFPGSDLNLAGWAKKITGKPTIAVGSVGLSGPADRSNAADLEAAAALGSMPDSVRWTVEMLDRGAFDLVAVGRAMLADPSWADKVRSGRWPDLQPFTPAMLARLE